MQSRVPRGRLAAVPDMDTGINAGYAGRVYAIAFDLDIKLLEEHYPGNTPTQGYGDIRKFLATHGFGHQQGSVYFGDATVDAVSCVLAVQEMAKTYLWLRSCVKDIRMLRIEENNDLGVAIEKVPVPSPAPEAESLFDINQDTNAA